LTSPGSFEEEVVRKAVFPRLAGFEGLHERMAVLLPMLAGVAILGVVTAPDLTADEAGSKVHPCVPGGDALFADIRLWGSL
jgi:hypothetical protein